MWNFFKKVDCIDCKIIAFEMKKRVLSNTK
jgi:hypothetical protein